MNFAVSEMVHEEVKAQLPKLWNLFKNEEIWKARIQLRVPEKESRWSRRTAQEDAEKKVRFPSSSHIAQ